MSRRRFAALAGIALVAAAVLGQPVLAQGAGDALASALRPLARPGPVPEGAPVAALPETAIVIGGQIRPQARMVAAPGRPESRPDDVVPQPVSAFLRIGGQPVGGSVDGLVAHISTRSVETLPVLTAATQAQPVSFLPVTPVRRSLIVTPIPTWESRTARDNAVSSEVAALAGLLSLSLERQSAADALRASAPPMRPAARPGTVAPAALPTGETAPLRPALRPYREPPPPPMLDPEEPLLVGQQAAGEVRPVFSAAAVNVAFRPPQRPASIAAAVEAAEAEAAEVRASLQRGSVCGQIDIQGVARGNVPGPGACGVENAVEIRSVAGIRLSQPTVITCATATALRDWVEGSAIPQLASSGGGLESLYVMGGYSCRTRNNVPGARLSEHSFGRAIDIGGFVLRNGTRITLTNDWNGRYGEVLRAMHRAACRTFGTVLGPEADAAHRDHFHFDVARHSNGAYCR